MSKRKKNVFGFQSARAPKGKYRAPGLIQTKRQRRVAGMVRRARGKRSQSKDASGVRSDVALALRNQGFSSREAKKLAARASGSDFDSMFRSAITRNPKRYFRTVTAAARFAVKKKGSHTTLFRSSGTKPFGVSWKRDPEALARRARTLFPPDKFSIRRIR